MAPYPNWITINLDHLLHNISELKSLLDPNCKFLFPVKADAYGHGSLACSFAAHKAGVNGLGVAHLFEGVAIRQYGSLQEILVMGPLTAADFDTCLKYQLTPTITRIDIARLFETFLQTRGVTQRVHLKLDTGMSRYGFRYDSIDEIREILEYSHVKVDGIFSHLACADQSDHSLNQIQIKRFQEFQSKIEAPPELFHLANSAGMLNFKDSHMNMVRPGLSCYGYYPNDDLRDLINLKPVMKLEATVRETHQVTAGNGVSYGHQWIAQTDTFVASVAIGYGDGYRRNFKETPRVSINGELCPIVGAICMDTILVNITHLSTPPVAGSIVIIIDGESHEELSIESVAKSMGTIPYELTCGVARRLQRKYIWRGQILLWKELKSQLGIVVPNEN